MISVIGTVQSHYHETKVGHEIKTLKNSKVV